MRLFVVCAVVIAGVGLAAPAQAATLSVAQYEAKIAALINQSRAAGGLSPVTVSVSMSNVSRAWSHTMASTGEFEHNPRYSSQIPSGWSAAGENIAYGPTTSGQYAPEGIHQGLMDSPGHRANIMRPGFTHLGIGVHMVTTGGRNYVYVTENFAAYPASNPPDGPAVTPRTPFRHLVLSPDATGDRYGDLFAVDKAGRLFLYSGSSSGAVSSARSYGTGWSGLDVYAPGDWNGDGLSDLLATDSKGRLWLYAGRGGGAIGSRSQIGQGWNGYRIIPAGDVSGDGAADLLAIDSSGRLKLYPGDGRGGFDRPYEVGHGWKGFDLYAAGDLTGDGRNDIVSIDSAGRLWFYAARGGGYFRGKVQVGHGWKGYEFASGADVNADGRGDLVGRDQQGRLWFYAGLSGGSFAMKKQIGQGW